MDKHYISKLVLPCLQLHFLGRYDDTKDYHTGDVVTKDGNPMVYTGGHFEDLIRDTSNATKEEQQTETRCIYCGAPLIKHNNRIVCEYCDTQYT